MVGTTTTTIRNDLIEMFLDATPGESYRNGRLKTRETENGVQLIAYHEHILAEVDSGANSITLFTGHYKNQSVTVTRYVHELGKLLSEREGFDVTVLDGYAPSTGYGRVWEAAQYIGQYVGSSDSRSPADKKAISEVDRALARAE